MLRCTKCNTDKDVDQFYSSSSATARGGRTHWCKKCYADNYQNNRSRQLLSNQRARIKKRYGISLEEYNALIAQGCSVCGPSATDRIVMDHCHATNALRSPLCNGCNVALGAAGDDPARLRALADYLESHKRP